MVKFREFVLGNPGRREEGRGQESRREERRCKRCEKWFWKGMFEEGREVSLIHRFFLLLDVVYVHECGMYVGCMPT